MSDEDNKCWRKCCCKKPLLASAHNSTALACMEADQTNCSKATYHLRGMYRSMGSPCSFTKPFWLAFMIAGGVKAAGAETEVRETIRRV